jgi:hypothetical protein
MTRLAALAFAAALLAGCTSARQPYSNDLAKNVEVRPALAKVRAALHIHRVDAQCRTQYAGTLDLDRPAIGVGLPPGAWSYLVFDFSSSGLLTGSRQMRKETLLRVRPNHRYEIDAVYRDDIYNVVMRERPAKGPARALPILDFASCEKTS